MIGRRQLFGAATASVVLASALEPQLAQATQQEALAAAAQLDKTLAKYPRGVDGRLVRLGTLHLESQHDFSMGFRLVHNRLLRQSSQQAFQRLLEREEIDPATPFTSDQVRDLIGKDPMIIMASKCWLANQRFMWKALQDHFHEHEDFYLSQMDAADKVGPGTLELAPTMVVPDENRHEIHIQPGGYVGDPFAGHIYHHGTNSFYVGTGMRTRNDQDQVHIGTVSRLPLPADGKVRRILDYGCGMGQFTVALKERFPDAEVWGIDIGGPMVRYGHMRANQLNVGANFAQRLAQDTKFPDGYFDIVTSYIAHHEMPGDVTLKVIEEARRLTRRGGVYYPVDFITGGRTGTPQGMFSRWQDHRWNNERWSMEYHAVDFNAEIAKRGFQHISATKPALPGFGARHFVRA
ncbi:class I SAM-dependent methyltransferase [Povalibacter sp.]|uniref:class I SAM-dependent methyltransferase n=1 Tax=Povalibacter sp. TaxID=1962978 RepID=UPI002F3FD269